MQLLLNNNSFLITAMCVSQGGSTILRAGELKGGGLEYSSMNFGFLPGISYLFLPQGCYLRVRKKIKCPQCPFESRDLSLKRQKIQCFFCPESELASSWVDDKNPVAWEKNSEGVLM